MSNLLALFSNPAVAEIQNRYVAGELVALNKVTEQHGIVLTQKDCADIALCRGQLLRDTERIEVGVGIVKRIIEEFCESGYVDQNTFRDTVEELLECFYTIKTETEDRLDDDTVLEFLKQTFETDAGGDVSRIYLSTAYDEFIAFGKKYIEKPKKDDY